MAKKNKDTKKIKNKKSNIEIPETDLFQLLASASRVSRTLLSRQLNAQGLYAGQDTVVLLLAKNDGLPVTTIAHILGVQPPTMTKTIARMALQGFVEKRFLETDARIAHIYLTEQGRQIVKSVKKSVVRSHEIMLKNVKVKDVEKFISVLSAIESNMLETL